MPARALAGSRHAKGACNAKSSPPRSQNAPPAIRGFGIFSLSPPAPFSNQLAGYNHVLVHYCSSDNWIGSARLAGINTSTGTAYDIRFQGEAIVNAVIETLLSGPTGADPGVATELYRTPLPGFQDATEIVLAGESAGGGGLRHHLDRLNFDSASWRATPLPPEGSSRRSPRRESRGSTATAMWQSRPTTASTAIT